MSVVQPSVGSLAHEAARRHAVASVLLVLEVVLVALLFIAGAFVRSTTAACIALPILVLAKLFHSTRASGARSASRALDRRARARLEPPASGVDLGLGDELWLERVAGKACTPNVS